MKILLLSSEVVPFAKTGGLADVCGALPVELQKLGNEVVVCLPEFRVTRDSGLPILETDIEFSVPVGSKTVSGKLLRSKLPDSDVTVFLVRQNDYFDRDGLYQSGGEDYRDNCERFTFFCRFVLEALPRLNWFPDLAHCNDWQTGLVPAYLKTLYADEPGYGDIASVMTIHNLAYQGNFWHWDMLLTGIDWQYFNWRQMEFYGRLNLLKTGLVFADSISTVSPRYALEIQTREQGCGLESVLHERRGDLSGILNGIDTRVWNPATDQHLAANYSLADWQIGKPKCKADLQATMGLPPDPGVPLVGIIGRMASQKGWALVIDVMNQWLREQRPVQWVVLGTGDPVYQNALRQLQASWPAALGLEIGFSDGLAHRIEAGCDMFLMPSRYEPCGLNQQYSLQYGTIPVVHETGGLADTVVDLNAGTLAAKTANGFTFSQFHAEALDHALTRAITAFGNPQQWQSLVETGMSRDWSWSAGAAKYQKLFEVTVHARRSRPQPA